MPSYQLLVNEQPTYAILQNVAYSEERGFLDYNCEVNDITAGDSDFSQPIMENNSMYLKIIEQPADTFRYRYKSEKGSHGGIKGENSSHSKKSFPTVQVQNCSPSLRKKIVVKVSLYTDNSQPHVYELTGKSCTGVTLDENYLAVFKSLTIAPRKKEEVIEFLKQRKKANYDSNRISYTKSSLEAEAQEEMKSLNLDSARLCFEAFSTDDINTPVCDKVFSNPVNNQKSAATGDLRIVRLSSFSAKCSGGDEVILLCEKIKKEDIKVRFFEEVEGLVVWTLDAEVVDIHHQLAITFKTPAYPQTDVTKEVFIELFRPSDGRRSEAKHFRYIPDDRGILERVQMASTVTTNPVNCEIPEVPRKRKRLSIGEFVEDFLNSSAMDSPQSINDEQSFESDQPMDFSSIIKGSDFDIIEYFRDVSDVPPVGNENLVVDDLTDYTHNCLLTQDLTACVDKIYGQMYTGPQSANVVVADGVNEISNCMGALSLGGHNRKQEENSEIQKASNDFAIGINAILQNRDEKTYLHYASHLIPLQDEDGNSLLHLAVMEQGSNFNFVRKMLQMVTADQVNHQNRFRETPLHLAVKGSHEKTLFLLLVGGGDPNLVDSDGNNCLHLAAKYGHLNCLKVLMPPSGNGRTWKHKISDVDVLNNDGMSALHLAVTREFEDCVNFLLSSKADVNLPEKKCGRTALHLAIEHPSLLKAILKQPEVDVEIEDFGGFTAVQLACMKTKKCFDISQQLEDKDEIVEFLLKLNLEEEGSGTESDDESTDSSEFEDAVEDFKPTYSNDCEAISTSEPSIKQEKKSSLMETERELCAYLDKDDNWVKLADLIGLDAKHVALFDEGLSPSQTVLRKIKELYPSSPLQSVIGSLQLAGLDEGVRILQKNS